MFTKGIFTRLLLTFIWVVLVSIFRWDWQLNLILLWLGAFLGTFLLDIDHIFYMYIHPHELTSIRFKRYLEQKSYKEALLLLVNTHSERIKLNFHNALFQPFLYVVCFFVLSTSGSLLGQGLVMAMALHLLKDEFECLLLKKEDYLRSLIFWPIKGQISLTNQKIFLIAMFLVFLGLNLFLI
ncbi:MAG: hypothetical protein Q7S03_01520 [bacterium]|nr:hypothetical protein [bacterium]